MGKKVGVGGLQLDPGPESPRLTGFCLPSTAEAVKNCIFDMMFLSCLEEDFAFLIVCKFCDV